MTRTKKIFVGGLSVNTTIEDVKQYFDQFGKVSVEDSESCVCLDCQMKGKKKSQSKKVFYKFCRWFFWMASVQK